MSNLSLETYRFYINSLTIYAKLRRHPLLQTIDKLCSLLLAQAPSFGDCISCYSELCQLLYTPQPGIKAGNLTAYVMGLVKQDDNLFSKLCAKGQTRSLDPVVVGAIKSDLNNLCKLSQLSSQTLKQVLCEVFEQQAEQIDTLPAYEIDKNTFQWGANASYFEFHYKQHPTGLFADAPAFRYSVANGIEPIAQNDPITFADLKHYTYQHERAKENTLAFLAGKPYNNVLLYGDRGTGKSSTVKALLNAYQDQGLRIISVAKSDLHGLDKLIALIHDVPLKFIVFIDDLTFQENDESFGVLKAILEGSVVKRPDNMAIYATTNRRHLIKETFTAREGDEIHKADTIDENLSLSDRFGLVLTYLHPNKDTFLDIVRQLAADKQLVMEPGALERGAEAFALERGARSPRLAKQYIDYMLAKTLFENK